MASFKPRRMPAVEGQSEAAVGPLGRRRRVEAAQADAPQHGFPAERPSSARWSGRRSTLSRRTWSTSGTRCSSEHAMLATSLSRSNRSPRKSRCSMTLMADNGVRPRLSAMIRRRIAAGRPSASASAKPGARSSVLESGEEQRVGQLVERRRIVAVTDDLQEVLAQRVWRRHRPIGASQRPGGQARHGYLQASWHPSRAAGPAVQRRKFAVRGVASEQLVPARARQSYGGPSFANGVRNVVGVQPIEGRLVQAVQRRF